jgi:hypothetical protein
MNRDLNYEYTEVKGGGIKCKNYIICETLLPKDWFDMKSCYLCTDCIITFGSYNNSGKGILEVSNNLECPICLEVTECISQPRCNHYACISCFKRCYYGDEIEEPIFPYPDIENEYYDDTENIKWVNDYPLIQIYNEECDKWEIENTKKYENEKNLRICPICRK